MLNYKIPPLNSSIFQTTLEVRISDINYGNHLGHDSLISLLHESRVRLLNKMGYTELNIHGLGVLVTNLVVNYLHEAFYSDKIIINIGILNISKTSFDMIYQVICHEKNNEIARALTSITFFNYKNAKISKIPQEFLTAVKQCSVKELILRTTKTSSKHYSLAELLQGTTAKDIKSLKKEAEWFRKGKPVG